VKALRAGAARGADRRVNQVGACPVVQLAVGNARNLARDRNAVANLLIRAYIKKRFLIRLGGFVGNSLRSFFDVAAVASDQDFFVLRHVITPMMFSSKAIGSLFAMDCQTSTLGTSPMLQSLNLYLNLRPCRSESIISDTRVILFLKFAAP